MSERQPSSPERTPEHRQAGEHQIDRVERPAINVEQEHRKQEHQAETARKSAEKLAISGKEHEPKHGEKQRQTPPPRHIKKQNYRLTMNRVEARLSAPERVFSKIVRNDAVEAVSNVAGKTIARPSGLLGGGLVAFLGMTITLYFARQLGFSLSGSEFIALTAGGWLLGVLIEVVYKQLRSLKRR